MITPESLAQFFAKRPSLSKAGVYWEAQGCPVDKQGRRLKCRSAAIDNILSGRNGVSEKMEKQLLPVLRKYGYSDSA